MAADVEHKCKASGCLRRAKLREAKTSKLFHDGNLFTQNPIPKCTLIACIEPFEMYNICMGVQIRLEFWQGLKGTSMFCFCHSYEQVHVLLCQLLKKREVPAHSSKAVGTNPSLWAGFGAQKSLPLAGWSFLSHAAAPYLSSWRVAPSSCSHCLPSQQALHPGSDFPAQLFD